MLSHGQGVEPVLNKRIRTRQERFLIGELLDHIAEIAQIVDEEFHRLVAHHLLTNNVQEINNNILKF